MLMSESLFNLEYNSQRYRRLLWHIYHLIIPIFDFRPYSVLVFVLLLFLCFVKNPILKLFYFNFDFWNFCYSLENTRKKNIHIHVTDVSQINHKFQHKCGNKLIRLLVKRSRMQPSMNSLAFSPANSSKHSILFESELHIIINTHMQNKNIQKTTNDDFRSHENFKPLIEICNLKRWNETTK